MLEELRIVRVRLPLGLVRRMDELLVAGVGGYETREEFIREAVDAFVLDNTYEEAPEELHRPEREAHRRLQKPPGRPYLADRPTRAPRETPPTGALTETTLRAPPSVRLVADPINIVVDEPLFGLHNRDYPSLWAATRLAEATRHKQVAFETFLKTVTEEGWVFGEFLRTLQQRVGGKLTSLFPTNPEKPLSSEEAFRAFAIGTISQVDGGLRCSGPLFVWRCCALAKSDGEVVVGLTEPGFALLRALDGLSVEVPHPPELASPFISHLRRYAPADWWGFQRVLSAVEPGIQRVDLVEQLKRARPEWSDAQAATNAAGYVARAREWGLIEPKQVGGRYRLTAFGRQVLAEEEGTDE